MNTLTVRDFRNQMAFAFDSTDAGERVLIRRKNHLYSLVSVQEDIPPISPTLVAKMEKARQEHREGKTLKFKTASDAQQWMDSL